MTPTKPQQATFLQTCTACGYRIDPAAGTIHPACEPGVAETFRYAARARNEARQAGERGKQAALNRDPGTRAFALNELRALTYRQRLVSADDLGDYFDAAGVPGEMRAGLWATAKARGWVEPVEEFPSERPTTHGKKITRYLSKNYRPGAA